MNPRKAILLFLILNLMFLLDFLSYVGYMLDVRQQIADVFNNLWSLPATSTAVSYLVVFALLRAALAWYALERLLGIKKRLYIAVLSIPLLTTEAVLRDFIFGIENVTKMVNEEGLGAYTVISKILFIFDEYITNSPLKNISIVIFNLIGTLILEIPRAIAPVLISKKGGENESP